MHKHKDKEAKVLLAESIIATEEENQELFALGQRLEEKGWVVMHRYLPNIALCDVKNLAIKDGYTHVLFWSAYRSKTKGPRLKRV